ncbi:Acidic mammalian chitinase, partial [Camelus dromedarius]
VPGPYPCHDPGPPGSWESYTGENRHLYKHPTDTGGNANLNIDYTKSYWKDNEAPAEKLMVGFPASGHTSILSNPPNMKFMLLPLALAFLGPVLGSLGSGPTMW